MVNAGRYEEAAALYELALSKDLTDVDNIRLAGMLARRIGRFDLAFRLQEHAVAIDPLCFMCIYQLSRTYVYGGDFERSPELREQFMAIGAGGNYHYGLTLILMGRAAEALDCRRSLPDDDLNVLHSIWQPLHNDPR